MAAPPTLPGNEPHRAEDVLVFPELPQEEFWEAYNKRMEFPLAAVGTVFLHVLVGAVLVYVLVGLMNTGEDRSNPPLKLMRVGGLGDVGEGSSGSGGNPDQEIIRDVDPYQARQKAFATPQALADARANIQKIVLDDPNGKLAIAPANAAAYQDLDEALRKKLLGVGGRQGDGSQLGMGYDGSPGSGPGGSGADSTRARGLRWVLRFRVIPGGRDYIDQLRTMRAEILVPITSDKDCIIVPDLSQPTSHRVATNDDFNRLAGKIQFSDNRPAMVREVLDALGIHAKQAKAFWAFFPKDIEEELAMKEKAYRNKRPEDIEETVFKVTIRGGKPEVVVEDQILKR
ncbi:MAG: hypothetical protein RMJ56_05565 [Gemmataceae bacterium]|nr:hypothetical protein [Gemmata sp.]MDW8197056.1 hypothetical protein [Gemmataceae bacterium]